MGIREYDHEYYPHPKKNIEGPLEENPTEKNNYQRENLCKNICLIISWSLVITLFLYIIMMEFS
tara:strand:+ start:398 stop:589 length:192 start_codon:yes stop_codon:yes gene_type:complete